MMPKPRRISEYGQVQTDLAETVLLEVWSRLGDFHEHLVLVGGLAPRYLAPGQTDTASGIQPHCGTMDVDLGVSLAVADLNAYSTIRECLTDTLGFEPGHNAAGVQQRHSFLKRVGDLEIVLDFLTTAYDGPPERIRRVEDDLSAIQVEGIGLALDTPLLVPRSGRLLDGGTIETTLRVCRPVPYIVLKALALDKRGEHKDAYDLVYVLRWADDSPRALASSARREEIESVAFQHAVDALQRHFRSPGHDGPVKYVAFMENTPPDAGAQAFATVQEFLTGLGRR